MLEIVIFDPRYWIFSLGISLNRYEECDDQEEWIRKTFEIGLLAFVIRWHMIRDRKKRED